MIITTFPNAFGDKWEIGGSVVKLIIFPLFYKILLFYHVSKIN